MNSLSPWSMSVSPQMRIAAGSLTPGAGATDSEAVPPGLKLAFLLEGRLDLNLGDGRAVSVAGRSLSLFLGREEWRLDHHFPTQPTLRYLTLHLDAGMVEDMLVPVRGDGVDYKSAAPSPAMEALVRQILFPPLPGIAGRLYLVGKGLELAGLALDRLYRQRSSVPPSLLSPVEVQRLQQLRELLDANPLAVNNLAQLARLTALNQRKMTDGFQQLFGCTIAEHIRNRRLATARNMLEQGASVTQAAEAAGYTLAHFTHAFRRHFGFNPGRLCLKAC